MTTISTPAAPNPVGPYSQAIKTNGFVFLSGQIPLDPSTMRIVDGGIREQTEQALRNVSELVLAAGSELRHVVRCVVYLKTMTDFAEMNEVYGRFFNDTPPVRTTIESGNLPKGALIEIEATALG